MNRYEKNKKLLSENYNYNVVVVGDTYQKENIYNINKVDFFTGNYERVETMNEYRSNNHSIKPTIDKIIERYKKID